MSAVFEHFIGPLLAVKPEIQHDDPETYLASLPELFEGETPEVYSEAVKQARFMARGHKFPSEDVLRKAIVEARKIVGERTRSKRGAICDTKQKPFEHLDKQAHKWARDAMKASTWERLSIAECWDKSMYQLLYSAAQQRLLKGGKLPHPHQDYCLEPEDHKYYKEHGQFTFADAGERCRYWGLSKAATAAIVDQKDAA